MLQSQTSDSLHVKLVTPQESQLRYIKSSVGYAWNPRGAAWDAVAVAESGFGDLYPTFWYSQLVGIIFILEPWHAAWSVGCYAGGGSGLLKHWLAGWFLKVVGYW